jgi:hypothetical protein
MNRRMADILSDIFLLNTKPHSEMHSLMSCYWLAVWNIFLINKKPGQISSSTVHITLYFSPIINKNKILFLGKEMKGWQGYGSVNFS